MVLDTPALYILLGLIVYSIAYLYYSKYVDRNIWQSDPTRPTPAKLYFDGVEYFPVSKYVLYGYQFKSVAALGPIVGPMIAVHFYGWLPALLWLIIGNFLIGWVQDYSAMMMSVRREGRSMGPIAYELLGGRARVILLTYLVFYLIIIGAVFAWVIIAIINGVPGVFIPIIVILITGYIFGHMVFRLKMSVVTATLVALILVFAGIIIVTAVQSLRIPSTNFLDPGLKGTQPASWTVLFWLIVLGVIYYLAATTPMIRWLLPTVYVAYLPAIIALVIVIIAALLSFITGVKIDPTRQAFVGGAYFDPIKYPTTGPLWPMLFVTIACGAISGWHSLISTGLSSKQLEFETDARPVGGGAMITEGIVGLSSVAAIMVVAAAAPPPAGAPAPLDYPRGAAALVNALIPLGVDAWLFFYAIFVTIMGLITSMLFVRVFRMVAAELFPTPFNHYLVSPLIWIALISFLAWLGSWTNLWLYFGGTNQLLAGLALMLVAVFLASQKRPTWYVFWPGAFMIVTTLSAILWETYVYASHLMQGKYLAPQAPVVDRFGATLVNFTNLFSAVFGIILFILGLVMAYYLFSGYFKYRGQSSQS
ncbi:MAG: carbon starvation CstA family protein [Acidilobaceae archaeon]